MILVIGADVQDDVDFDQLSADVKESALEGFLGIDAADIKNEYLRVAVFEIP